MTTNREPDRILRAWLDQMPDEAPDRAIAAVLQATAAAPQARALPRVSRWRFPMNRLSLAAVSAVTVILVLVGGVALLSSNRSSIGAPGASPSASPSATSSVAGSPAATFSIVPLPAVTRGDWVADPGPLGLPEQGPRIQLSFDWDKGLSAWVQTNYQTGTQVFNSDSVAAPSDQIRLVSQKTADGCTAGNVGTYGWNRSADGEFLTVTLINDECTSRATTLARTWVHTLSAVTDGGLGVMPGINLQLTLPARRFGLGPGGDLTTFDSSPFLGFLPFEDPTGFKDPCSATTKNPLGANTTSAAVVAYLRGLPGYTFKTASTTIDGRPAVHVTGTPKSGFTCAAGEVGLFWATGTNDWTSPPANPLSFWVADIDGNAWLFWYRGDNLTPADEAQVISSIHFITSLPTP